MKSFDFENDTLLETITLSKKLGIKLPKDIDLRTASLDYLTVYYRYIPSKPRTVKVSPVLQTKVPGHPKCNEILTIIGAASQGYNLNPFQSKKLPQTRFHDHLRNEWFIYHFHLSLDYQPGSTFVKQGNQLLFAYIDDKYALFLDTDTHREGVFGDVKWIEILYDYYPGVIAKFKDDKIVSLFPKVNSIERQSLWNKGYSLGMTEVKGQVYLNPGVGRSTSGHSVMVTKQVGAVLRWIHRLSEQVEDSYSEICRYLNVSESSAQFKIRMGEVSFELTEEVSQTSLLTFPEILMDKKDIIAQCNE